MRNYIAKIISLPRKSGQVALQFEKSILMILL